MTSNTWRLLHKKLISSTVMLAGILTLAPLTAFSDIPGVAGPTPDLTATVNVASMGNASSDPNPGFSPNVTTPNDFAALKKDFNWPYEPADLHAAVGPANLFVVTNPRMRIQDRVGNTVKTIDTYTFWSALGSANIASLTDPKIVFDVNGTSQGVGGRWVMTIIGNYFATTEYLLLAVSKSADPLGDWSLYRYPLPSKIDQPKLGFSRDCVVVTGDVSDSQQQIFLWGKQSYYRKLGTDPAVNIPGLYEASSTGVVTKFLEDIELKEASVAPSRLTPAVSYGDALGAGQYFVWAKQNDSIQVEKAYYSSSVQNYMLNTSVGNVGTPSGTYSRSPYPNPVEHNPQANGPLLRDSDPFIKNCVFRNGSLWCVRSIWFGYTAVVEWWQVQVNPSVARIQFGRVLDPGLSVAYDYPNIAVNANNDVLIGFNTFSATTYPSAAYVGRWGQDPASTVRGFNIFRPGVAPYPSGAWGDYSSATVDPVDDSSLWTTLAYTETLATDGSGRWGMQWAKLDGHVEPIPPSTPSSSYVIDLGPVNQSYQGGSTTAYGVNNVNNQSGYPSVVGYGYASGSQVLGYTSDGLVSTAIYPPGVIFGAGVYARSINSTRGTVGTTIYNSFSQPYRRKATTMEFLATPSGAWGDANGINDSGLAVGRGRDGYGVYHATYWPDGTTNGVNLGSLDGSLTTSSSAWGVNNLGRVIGQATTSDGKNHAFVTPPSSGAGPLPLTPICDLGTIGGFWGDSAAYGISDSGSVVGSSIYSTTTSLSDAFYADNLSTSLVDMGNHGGVAAQANAVNNWRRVVGVYQPSGYGNSVAFVWDYRWKVMVDLNAYLPYGSGWSLLSATGINDAGWIVGYGYHGSYFRAFLFKPNY